jgi:hypothetical protein
MLPARASMVLRMNLPESVSTLVACEAIFAAVAVSGNRPLRAAAASLSSKVDASWNTPAQPMASRTTSAWRICSSRLAAESAPCVRRTGFQVPEFDAVGELLVGLGLFLHFLHLLGVEPGGRIGQLDLLFARAGTDGCFLGVEPPLHPCGPSVSGLMS